MLNIAIVSTLNPCPKESKRKAAERGRHTNIYVTYLCVALKTHVYTAHHVQSRHQENPAQIRYLGRKSKGNHTAPDE